VFIRKLPTSNVQITRQLANYRLQDGEGIMDYWRRGHDLRVRHQALQGAMTTLSWLTHVLAGLPSSWDPIIQIRDAASGVADRGRSAGYTPGRGGKEEVQKGQQATF